ncbi:hypothetical protein G9A89_015146 [Geosiphon pyriformis]|nr:hypothetical protein G9A89_015146 [Geosiphon pyriformis]
MTDFSLTDGYRVHNGLDQEEKSVCEYRLISYFVFKSGHAKSQAGLFFFFAAGVFVDNTIWVGSSQSATQHILNVASEFFWINNISINNNKTVVIPINSRYLGIFLSTEGLSKLSLAKANSDVHFFTNLVLRKAVSNKQFLYLVSAVFHPIVNYRMQFSFVLDALVCKGLKIKSGLPINFLSDTIHHLSFYDLKSFVQVQSESKIASLVSFANSGSILGHLFSHSGVPMSAILGELKFLRCLSSLQWYDIAFVDQLYDCYGAVFDWYTFKHWKRLDSHGPVSEWFKLSAAFFNNASSLLTSPVISNGIGPVNIFDSDDFVSVCKSFSQVGAGSLSVYMDRSLKDLGTVNCRAGAAVFFENIGLGLGISVLGLMPSTLAELQAIALALECIPLSSSVHLYSDSQAALDACRSELNMILLDFRNQYWVEHQHIVNVI